MPPDRSQAVQFCEVFLDRLCDGGEFLARRIFCGVGGLSVMGELVDTVGKKRETRTEVDNFSSLRDWIIPRFSALDVFLFLFTICTTSL